MAKKARPAPAKKGRTVAKVKATAKPKAKARAKVGSAPKGQAKRSATAAIGPRPPRGAKVAEIVSIPPEVVLSPQSEAPRQGTGTDRSGSKSQVRELTWADFDRWVQSLARDILGAFHPQAVVGVVHGGVFVGGALARALDCDFFPVRVSPRSRDKSARSGVLAAMPSELRGKRVLLVDDVAGSGDTLRLAAALAEKAGCKETRTACLVRREGGFAPSFSAAVVGDFVVFPWDYEPVVEDVRFDVDPDKAGA